MRVALIFALALAACGPADPAPCGVGDLAPLPTRPTYALVSSDYTSTAIGLLDTDGSLITDAWVDSGTTRPGIVAALSGDVSLPTQPFARCTLVLLDRFGTDVVSVLDVCGDEVVRSQVDVGSTFAANPHDVLQVSGATWVTRYTTNLGAEAGDLDRGGDLVALDAGRVARRIDLSAIADEGDALARPDRMVFARGPGLARVVVGLARLSPDFAYAAPGAVAVVDPETEQASLHLVSGLRNCGEVDIAEDARSELGRDAVLVTCQGAPFADEAGRREGAGVVAYRLDAAGALVEVAAWRAAAHPDAPVPSGPTIVIDADRWFTVAWGDLGADVPDRVLRVSDGVGEVVLEAPPFSVGDGVYDQAHDLLLLPDADAGVVRRFRADGTQRAPIESTGCHGLAPREVRRIAFP